MEIEKFERKLDFENPIFLLAENSILKNNLFFLTQNKRVAKLGLSDFNSSECFDISDTKLNFDKELILKLSPTERFCVIAEKYLSYGIVVDLEKSEIALEIKRDDYHVK